MADVKHIVRIANTDLKGTKQIVIALSDVKGIGMMFAHALCQVGNLDGRRAVGTLTDAELQRIDEILKQPTKFGIPDWLLNRRQDPELGANRHMVTNDMIFVQENDVKMMTKMKCWKGVRHMLGQPVRGQKTRSKFRKNKGNVMGVRVASKKGGTT